MSRPRTSLLLVVSNLAGLIRPTTAAVHRLVSANRFAPERLHSIEFDDEANTLKLVKTAEANNTHVWISLSHDKQAIYGSSMENGRLASYESSTLEVTGVVETSGMCAGKNSAYNIASSIKPYYVFSGSYSRGADEESCGMSIQTNEDGAFDHVAESWLYGLPSSAHGLALYEANGNQLLYTANMGTDTIWVHSVNETGKLDVIGYIELDGENRLKPRHIMIHSEGTYAYVTQEEDNSVVAIPLNSSGLLLVGGQPNSLSLIPDGLDNSQYWAAAISLSPNGRYLWATSRGRGENTGYISCFLLSEAGALLKLMFRIPTGTAGTTSSSISTAPWSDEYAVFADAPGGYVRVFKLAGGVKINDGLEYASANAVASLDIDEGSCCGNPVWLS